MPFIKGHPNYILKHSEETKKKISESKLGSKNPRFGLPAWNKNKVHLPNEKNPAWKGNKVNKPSIHSWVRKHFIKSGICERCEKKNKTEWSNKDHKYNSRERNMWQELCRSCHLLYDYKYLNRTKYRTTSQSYGNSTLSA